MATNNSINNILMPWVYTTSAVNPMSVNTGYICDLSSLGAGTYLGMTLPTTAAVGDLIFISQVDAAANRFIRILQNANQIIFNNTGQTSTGTGGYLYTLGQDESQSIQLLCTVADTEFVVINEYYDNSKFERS